MSNEGREIIVARLIEDLVGPSSADETITDKPSDRYLLGFLSPKETHVGEDEDERLESAEDDEQDAPVDGTVSLGRTMRPSTMGLSFAARSRDASAPPTLAIRVQCGTYEPIAKPPRDAGKAPPPDWKRTAHDVNLPHVRTSVASQWLSLAGHGLPGIKLFVRAMRAADAWSVTVALINDQDSPEDAQDRERCTVFQSSLSVRATDGSRLVARPSRRSGKDADALAAALLYRDAREFAVGHTCSASWEGLEHDTVQSVCTEWVPTAVVPAMSSSGDDTFAALSSHSTLRPLSPGWLATQASDQELASALREVPACYERWIAEQREKLSSLSPPLLEQANRHLAECQKSADRMREAAALIESDPAVRSAFRLAQQAMWMQYFWGRQEELQWFPFQLGFQLQALCSIAERKHPDRRIMDLLWFPTGGGKTEAYLALTAFTLFLRRLRDGSGGAGIAVLMRYTLRLLTIQQFERAAAMICACELLRRGHQRPPGLESEALGDEMFSIGLWVGGAATPNTVAAAKQASSSDGSNARQLSACPVCKKSDITWGRLEAHKQFSAECKNKQCEFSKTGSHLPVWTVDEDIYRVRPSLLIGTVDKFAQIVRKEECQSIFAADHLHHPIDLIIQDELHLISGPLGTIAAIYEIAIDELLSRGPVRPKILGSTATIRRADEQICALFNRATSLFPSPGLDAENSGFAVRDRKQLGRLYVGVSTVGRSPKFALQATSASLLQSGQPSVLTAPAMLDAYRTLVAYFNSLRELGGALVLMMDDVSLSLGQIAKRRGAEDPRRIEEPQELTSRVRSIRDVLDRIQKPVASGEAVDVVLASNMISVGVDVRRLSLMLVNGQPKGISEYIQATSRVGRGTIPGLVVVLYNDNKVRDRAHYETFAAWHQTLYREVEATSVTPFASRARDRALHAALVALVRYRVKGMLKKPRITAGPQRDDVKRQTEVILERVRQIEPSSLPAVEKELLWLCDDWLDNDKLEAYWDERGGKNSLLLSAERFAALQTMGSESEVAAWKTLNSMREVEPSTTFTLRPVFKNADSEAGNGEE